MKALMKLRWFHYFLLSSTVVLVCVIFTGCGEHEMDSRWCDRTVTIDGIDSGTEWENTRFFFDQEQVTVGLMNTESMLYVRLSTRDPRIQRELMAYGFTLWFSEKGEKKKSLGVHYPKGSFIKPNHGAKPDDSFEEFSHKDSLAVPIKDEIEMIGPAKGARSILPLFESEKQGIRCKIGNTQDNLVYELQFPLLRTDSSRYGISTNKIMSFEICFETGKVDPDALRKQEEENKRRNRDQMEPKGGLIKDASGYSAMMRQNRMRENAIREMHNPLEMWLKVNLAVNKQDKR